MGENGGLLSSGDMMPQRSYGAVRSQSIMLSYINSQLISHKLNPSDTLQGIAIKYGISVERLKRVNKLWSNDSIHTKDTIMVPMSSEDDEDFEDTTVPCASIHSFSNSFTDDENRKKKIGSSGTSSEEEQENEDDLSSSSSESEKHLSNNEVNDEILNKSDDNLKTCDSIFSKIDGQIKVYKDLRLKEIENSEAIKSFNKMLDKIDCQIKLQKTKNINEPVSDIPVVAYDGGYQSLSGHSSPTKQHPFLEQGI